MSTIATNQNKTRQAVGLILCLGLVPLLGGGTGCASSRYAQSADEHNDDRVTSSRVRSALADDRQHQYFEGVHVETFKDVVQLSGFVNTRELKSLAGDIAREAASRRDIRNNITVKE